MFAGAENTLNTTQGTEVLVTATPAASAASMDEEAACASTVVGRGELDADNVFTITLTPLLPDGAYVFGICAGPYSSIMTLEMDNPFALTAPAVGTTLVPDNATASGVGSPGSTVEARDEHGSVLGESAIEADGAWSMPLAGLHPGPVDITFAQDAKTFAAEFVVVGPPAGEDDGPAPEDGAAPEDRPAPDGGASPEPDADAVEPVDADDTVVDSAVLAAPAAARPLAGGELASTGGHANAGIGIAAAVLVVLAGIVATVTAGLRRRATLGRD